MATRVIQIRSFLDVRTRHGRDTLIVQRGSDVRVHSESIAHTHFAKNLSPTDVRASKDDLPHSQTKEKTCTVCSQSSSTQGDSGIQMNIDRATQRQCRVAQAHDSSYSGKRQLGSSRAGMTRSSCNEASESSCKTAKVSDTAR